MLELKGAGRKGGNRSKKEQKAWSGQQKRKGAEQVEAWKTLGAAGHAPTAECGHSRLELLCWAHKWKAPRLRYVHKSRTPDQSHFVFVGFVCLLFLLCVCVFAGFGVYFAFVFAGFWLLLVFCRAVFLLVLWARCFLWVVCLLFLLSPQTILLFRI